MLADGLLLGPRVLPPLPLEREDLLIAFGQAAVSVVRGAAVFGAIVLGAIVRAVAPGVRRLHRVPSVRGRGAVMLRVITDKFAVFGRMPADVA